MSIATEVQRLRNAKESIRLAINAKGGALEEERIDEYASAIDALLPKDYAIRVRFIDYDGAVLKETYVAYGATVEPPENPVHDGLVFQKWNCKLDSVYSHRDIGAVYTTASGASEFDVTMVEALGSTVTLNPCVESGTLTVDWGDGVTDTSTSTGQQSMSHTYSEYGNYTVKISASESGKWYIKEGFCKDNSGTGCWCLVAARLAGISKIDAKGFQYHYGLRRVMLGTDITTLGEYAFRECSSLTAVVLPDSATVLGRYLFYYCYALSKLVFSDKSRTIQEYVCSECYSIDAVTLPDGVTTINPYAFYRCYALRIVDFPPSLLKIDESAFQECRVLESADLPKALQHIGEEAFYECHALKSVHIPNTVGTLEEYAFQNCTSLKAVAIPTGIKVLSNSCFENCYSLETVEIHEQVTSLEYEVFRYCRCLRELTFPAGLTKIGDDAFSYCTALQRIRCLGTTPPTISGSPFENIPKSCVVYVPKSDERTVLTAYKTASGWSTIASQIVEWEEEE